MNTQPQLTDNEYSFISALTRQCGTAAIEHLMSSHACIIPGLLNKGIIDMADGEVGITAKAIWDYDAIPF